MVSNALSSIFLAHQNKKVKIKSRKLAYTFINVLLNWTITKEGLKGFWVNLCLSGWFYYGLYLWISYYEPLQWLKIIINMWLRHDMHTHMYIATVENYNY